IRSSLNWRGFSGGGLAAGGRSPSDLRTSSPMRIPAFIMSVARYRGTTAVGGFAGVVAGVAARTGFGVDSGLVDSGGFDFETGASGLSAFSVFDSVGFAGASGPFFAGRVATP